MVDRLVQVFDKDVARVGLAQSRVAVTPHDPQGPAIDLGVVEGLQRALGCAMGGRWCRRVLQVDDDDDVDECIPALGSREEL